jgi:type IV secretion system protein VirD4
LPVGWTASGSPRFGFAPPTGDTPDRLLRHAGDGHLLTVAPTGAGKGRCGVIPALLTHPGPTLTIDIKGENYAVTARARRAMGHRVVAIDPFRLVVPEPDSLNPLDLIALPGGEPELDTELLAELLCGGRPISSKDVFWELTGKGMLTGLIGYAAEHAVPDKRTLPTALDMMYADDADYNIAVVLDTHKFANGVARQELVAYLQHESDRCRPSVRSTAQAMVKCLGSQAVRRLFARTSFELSGWLRGDPMDIFVIFPPDKLASHRAVLRLILGTLLSVLLRRPAPPGERTLLLLDECGQLGTLPQLATALTLMRGYGVQVWTFWQDLSQLKALYPDDWETVLNNSGVIQAFGLTNGWAARTAAEVLGVPVPHLLRLGADEQLVSRPGRGTELARRVDYLTDDLFAGRFDLNPRHRAVVGR